MATTRFKCPHCNKAVDVQKDATLCPECKREINTTTDAYIYLYRQGSVYGIAGAFGVYINGEPYGYIGNRQLLRIPVPYGTYNIHCAVGMSRKCRDMQVTLTPENRESFSKVYIKPGFWTNSFVVEPLDPKLLDGKF